MSKKANKKADKQPILTVKQKKMQRRRNIVKDIIIFVAVFAAILLIFRFVKFPRIQGSSMAPDFQDGDRALALMTNDVDVNDIVIVWNNEIDEYIIKRVVGVAGDHIEIYNGCLYRNGVKVYEGYINNQVWGFDYDKYEYESYDVVVPENEIFVLGDNRNQSTDSRVLGTMSCDDIQMKVIGKANWINKFRK
jgi:signal peptidase I